ncbi:hypothetical protein L798_13255 [Zootermopsis nevadensis]|uniref:Uncharacterized protein n=1 Tax=Zootermopsis nevadensis TaxID=136037 RepID=A0A067R1Q6_ZOONE|nr:hypothetical protein L798_13255 [Zootermopsis nevadensis]
MAEMASASASLFSCSVTPMSGKQWSPCGCFAARARTQVGFFVFYCLRQQLCGHRTASKMKHVAAELPHVRSLPIETVRSINSAEKTLRSKPLVRAGSYSCIYSTHH